MVVSVGVHAASPVDEFLTTLRSLTDRFDQGVSTTAGELATCLQTLLRPAQRVSAPDLRQRLTWVDTAGVLSPKNTSASSCLTLMKIRTGLRRGGDYVPKFGLYPPAPIRTRSGEHIDRGSRIPFDHWWTNPVLRDAAGNEFCRRQLVLAVAHAAGATRDDEAAAAHRAVAASATLGWVVSGELRSAARSLESNPIVASVRQIAYEVTQTIREQRDLIDGSLVA
jgi:hypothetical protein